MKQYKFMDAPKFLGQHPEIKRMYVDDLRNGEVSPLSLSARRTIPVSRLIDDRHPAVTLIPRDQHMVAVDSMGDTLWPMEHQIWFASENLYINTEHPGIFSEMSTDSDAFWRIGGISQLGYLVPPYPERCPQMNIAIMPPTFPHTRWNHCLIAAGMADVILAQNGFSEAERITPVLAVGFHDIAMPAGGDSVKRIAPKELDEEHNFLFALKLWGLIEKWKQQFGFDPHAAQEYVYNRGMFGALLDVVDKLSYVCLDAYCIARMIDGPMRTHCTNHPLFMDVWRDIVFTKDKQRFAFTDPDRLYQFILARAYEHKQLLLNPYARMLDFFLTNLVKPHFEKGEITKSDLLSWTTEQLQQVLAELRHGERVSPWIYEPEEYEWRRFSSREELHAYTQAHRTRVYYTEHLKGFRAGLHWPVYADKKRTRIVPLFSLLSNQRIQRVTHIVDACKGFYAYSYKWTP